MASAMASTRVPPNPTLYVHNLNDKIKKEELRRSLYALFTPYGRILDLIHKRSPNMRGQAHVVFANLTSSTSALRSLNGKIFYAKELKIEYARTKSWAIAEKEQGREEFWGRRLRNIAQGLNGDVGEDEDEADGGRSKKLTVSAAQKAAAEAKKEGLKQERIDAGEEDEDMDEGEDEEAGPAAGGERRKKRRDAEDEEAPMEEDSDEEAGPTATKGTLAPPDTAEVGTGNKPHHILFVEGLPGEVTEDMVVILFQQYPGFSHARLMPSTTPTATAKSIAFIQYDTTGQADIARSALDGFTLAPGVQMSVGFARSS